MHKNEKWQLFYNNGEPIPGKWRSAELDNPEAGEDEIVGGAVIYLYRKNQAGEIELLWQQRAMGIRNFPGKWDVSAGGHVNFGESFGEAAVREAMEEIGVEISVDKLEVVALRRNRKNMVNLIYLVDWTGREENFKFDDGEVSQVRWVPLAETDSFRKEFGKPPVAEDDATYISIQKWFKDNGNL
ncbi:NUDIX domain-containing protein [Candidatus Saccharibacteria bacterium]|nr:NUDIX domain-containing protein [Candidatus Saccharibacteria bacterium]